jgi:predicted nucleic acid-binding Zn ribbon protein
MVKEGSGLKEHPKPPKGGAGAKGTKLLQHRHCQVCSKAIPLSEEFCSEECNTEFDKMVKKRRNFLYLFYGMVVLFIILMIFSSIQI